MTGRIVWLASYPKSGNTWMRIFLTNYLRNGKAPADINDLESTPIASSRPLFETETGIEASDLTPDEIDYHRRDVYQWLAGKARESLFMKVHDAYTHLPNGEPLFPSDATRGAIYIVRNPLDVAVSGANHVNRRIDEVIHGMASEFVALGDNRKCPGRQFRQRLLSWSDHVRSWVDTAKEFPVHIVRYEDMKHRALETFCGVIRFAGLAEDIPRIKKAIAFSSFDVLQGQEEQRGFKERPSCAERFFRKGEVGSWQERLTNEQITQIVSGHGAVMQRFGYRIDEAVPEATISGAEALAA